MRAHIGPLDASGHFPGREQSAVRKGSAKHMQQQQQQEQEEEQQARNNEPRTLKCSVQNKSGSPFSF